MRKAVLLTMAIVLLVGCSSKGQVNDEGAFEGSVSRVWEDGMNLDLEGATSIRIDTWSVCGDATATNISIGDSVQVWATRDLFSYEAWRILNAEGEPAC